MNTSIVTGLTPENWKNALICPTFKKGDLNEPSDYRPISLLPIMSKVLERIIADQLYEYISDNQLFSNTQHGFRKHLSTETALVNITEKMYNNIDDNKISLLTLCDLSKAFDSVSHPILLSKMGFLYIDEFWFKDYLSNRTQAVKINNHVSSKQVVEFGVPQGSVLGPILFNIFINDLNDALQLEGITMIQFADDVQFMYSDKIENLDLLVNKTEQTMMKINEYFSRNGLKINSSKTQFLFVGSRSYILRIPEEIRIRVGSAFVKPSDTVKNLGLTMDRFLSFDDHVLKLCNKATGLLCFINRNKDYLDKTSRKIIVESLITSLFTYCSVIWGGCSAAATQKLQRAQNFSSKIIDGTGKKYDRATPFIEKLNWLKMDKKLIYDILVFVFKVLKGDIPNYAIQFPYVNSLQGRRNTRQDKDLLVPRKRTFIADRALNVKGPKYWNSLPLEIKSLVNLKIFKSKLKAFLLL